MPVIGREENFCRRMDEYAFSYKRVFCVPPCTTTIFATTTSGPQGGAFDKDLDYERTVIGSGKIIKGLELALKDMKAGSVRQVVIPYGELSYPADDSAHDRVGPKPTTFSGQRALNFVLDNPRLDRTLLFNVKVVRVDKSDGKGGFFRG